MSLAALRTKAELSQEELGRLTAPKGSKTLHHQPRIYSYEKGTKAVSLETARKIVRVLNRRFKRLGLTTQAKLEDIVPKKVRA